MTAQMNDVFRYRDDFYSLAGISEGGLFEPALIELEPVGTCTSCWRGYVATFAILETRLVLDCLDVNLYSKEKDLVSQTGPVINGVSPTGEKREHNFFNNHYKGLAYHLEYTGGLLLAKGFIEDLYVHMGFHPAWKYETVFELVFENGILRQEFDRSERMMEIREKFLDTLDQPPRSGMPEKEEIEEFIARSFDRSYRF